MKKLFLVGALAASMAFSSSALAAVNYGEANSIAATLNEDGTISVTTTLADETITSGQLTILVLDKDIDEVITNEETGETTKVTFDDSNIMYIDQASVTDNAVFENMGLLNPNEAETAYIRVGGDLGINIMTAELALVEEEEGTPVKFLLGDVNNSGAVDGIDALDIMSFSVNTSLNKTGLYEMGSLMISKMESNLGEDMIFGDVNNSGATDGIDALDIMSFSVNTSLNKTGLFEMDKEISALIPVK